MKEGEEVSLADIRAEQHFTEPPPRYNDATLVKALEEYGIGRPSTYASIISRLQEVKYMQVDNKRFIPTDIGRIVNKFLTDHFHRYVDYGFTAHMEDELDEISRGERDWIPVLDEFWEPFQKLVKDVETNVTREQVAQARDLGTDPATGRPVSVRMGRFGPFAQLGDSKNKEEKLKFAGLRPGQKMTTITLPEALELFKLPRKLGTTADGEPVSASVGRFGPYVQYGKKYVSIKTDDPYTITLERALELIREKQVADANRLIRDFPDHGIQVLNGRYGPYITDKTTNARVPKDRDPKSLALEECQALLAAAPARRGRFRRGRAADSKPAAEANKVPAKPKMKRGRAKPPAPAESA
jgi:DNA topoisomerase-1